MLTDDAGRFTFVEVYPGAHDIVPSLSLWRRESAMPALTTAPLTVPPAGRVDTGRLRMPASPKMSLVEIVIEDSAGNPAAGARVTFENAGSFGWIREPPPADATGTFRVTVVAGRRYEVEVWHRPVAPAGALHETAKVVIETTGMKPIRLRLAPQR